MNLLGDEDEEYPRLNVPLYWRPSRTVLPFTRPAARDAVEARVSVWSDEPLQVGERLAIEALLSRERELRLEGEVVWVRAAPRSAPAAFVIGLRLWCSAQVFEVLAARLPRASGGS